MTEEQDGRVSGGGEHVNTAEGAEMVRGRAFPLGPRYTDFKFLGEGEAKLNADATELSRCISRPHCISRSLLSSTRPFWIFCSFSLVFLSLCEGLLTLQT